jgi:hypothetical protein
MTRPLIISIAVIFLITSASAQLTSNAFDTLSKNVINFDDSSNQAYISIHSGPGQLWQIASAQKTGMAGAWSAPNVLVTDSVNSYPQNNSSNFDIILGHFNVAWYPMMIGVAFRHQFDTDTTKDGGFISVSWDNGLTYRNVALDTGYLYALWGSTPLGTWDIFGFNRNLYPDSSLLFNGEPGFSGTSGGWTETSLAWYIIPIKKSFPPDTMRLRFSFVSDSIFDNRSGWMIDDIMIYSIELPGSVREDGMKGHEALAFPNPAWEKVAIRLGRTHELIEIRLINIEGQSISSAEFHHVDGFEYDLSGLASGTYLISITYDGQRQESLRLQVSKSR